jgi:hypothetical protein
MKNTRLSLNRMLHQCLKIVTVLLCAFLAQCAREETPPPPEPTKPSLVDQYKESSKATAENPGVAGAPGQAKEEEKKSGE